MSLRSFRNIVPPIATRVTDYAIRAVAIFAAALAIRQATPRWLKHRLVPLIKFPIGRLMYATQLYTLGTTQFLELLGRDEPTRQVLLQDRRVLRDPRRLLAVSDRPELVALVSRQLVSNRVDSVSRSHVLYETIALGSAEAGRHRVEAALRATDKVAKSVLRHQAEGMLRVCLNLGQQPVDPYEPPGLSFWAKSAAASLIQHHSQLDQQLIERMGNKPKQMILAVLAAGLQGRPHRREETLAALLQRWAPSRREALAFSKDCDSKFSAADPLYVPRIRERRYWYVTGQMAVGRWIVPVLVVVVAVIATLWSITVSAERSPISLGVAESLAALGLLIAVHVLSTELSAARLPGLVARYSAVPPALLGSYVAALCLLVASAIASREADLAVELPIQLDLGAVTSGLSWTALVSAFVFVVLVLFVMGQLVRRTDTALAGRAFIRRRLLAYRRAGRRIGRVQRKARLLKLECATLPYVRLDLSPSRSERRVVITSPGRGFHLPSARRLTRLAGRPRWRDGKLILHIADRFGAVTDPLDELGAVAPDEESTVRHADYRVARRILKVEKLSKVEEVMEAFVTLVQMIVKLLAEGDEGGARRLGQSLIELTESHLQGIHQGRRGITVEEGLLPVAPTLKAQLTSLIGALASARAANQQEALTDIAQKLVKLGDREDALVALTVARVRESFDGEATGSNADEVLREAAMHALVGNDSDGLRLIRDAVSTTLRVSAGERRVELLDLVNYVAATSVWLNYWQCEPSWEWYWGSEDASQHVVVKSIRAMRVGGAAVLAGNVSVALRVALDLRDTGVDLSLLEGIARTPTVASREQFRADALGRYLGPDAEEAMARFARFAAQVGLSVQA
jgi:hypothetical protein